MKGILLTGGSGTRLYPVTRAVSKHLLPIYDKPMFFYPLCTLIEAGISEILIITNPKDALQYKLLMGDGSNIGLSIQYAVQPFPIGIADALRIGRPFICDQRVALILGDNIFLGDFSQTLKRAAISEKACIFTYKVQNPSEFGVAQLEKNGKVVSIEEKPEIPKDNHAVTGLYFYPPDCCDIADALQPSHRGELEITDVNRAYLERGQLKAFSLNRKVIWLDTGTFEGILAANNIVAKLISRGETPGCIEERVSQLIL